MNNALPYMPPELSRTVIAQVEQGFFNFLCPYKGPWLEPHQAAKVMGRSRHFVYSMVEEGRLEASAPMNREVKRYMITRRSVLLLVAAMANNFDSTERRESLLEIIDAETDPVLLAEIAARANARRNRLPAIQPTKR